MYAIGGSENPTILSEGNRFTALNDNATKEARLPQTLLLLLQKLICLKKKLSVKQKYIIKVHFLSFPFSMTLHLNKNSESAVLCTNHFLSTRMWLNRFDPFFTGYQAHWWWGWWFWWLGKLELEIFWWHVWEWCFLHWLWHWWYWLILICQSHQFLCQAIILCGILNSICRCTPMWNWGI